MKRLLLCWLLAIALCWLSTNRAWADQAEDEAAIRKNAASYAAAFNKGDAKAVAELWLPDAVYVDPDTDKKIVGRPAIEKHFAAIFKDAKNAKLTVEVDSVRFVSTHVAVERGTAIFVSAKKDVSKNRYSAIHVKRDGKWLLDRVADEDEAPTIASNYDKLKDLEWLVGNWVDADDKDNVAVETTCKWAKNQNFLVRTFTVTVGDNVETSGVQIIGWDPTKKQIRSWVFDSEGGFGEGTWSKKGKAWYIQTRDTLPNGQRASGVTIITVTDKNSFTSETVDRQVGGQLAPNVAPVAIIRKTVAE
jgi:uncharacterized protein (TIGR02246 family)